MAKNQKPNETGAKTAEELELDKLIAAEEAEKANENKKGDEGEGSETPPVKTEEELAAEAEELERLRKEAEEAVKANESRKAEKRAKEGDKSYELSDNEFKGLCLSKSKEFKREKLPTGYVYVQWQNHSSLRKNRSFPNPGDISKMGKANAEAMEAAGKVKILSK